MPIRKTTTRSTSSRKKRVTKSKSSQKSDLQELLNFEFPKSASVLVVTVAIISTFMLGLNIGSTVSNIKHKEEMSAYVARSGISNFGELRRRRAEALFGKARREPPSFGAEGVIPTPKVDPIKQAIFVERVISVIEESGIELPDEVMSKLRLLVQKLNQKDDEKIKDDEQESAELDEDMENNTGDADSEDDSDNDATYSSSASSNSTSADDDNSDDADDTGSANGLLEEGEECTNDDQCEDGLACHAKCGIEDCGSICVPEEEPLRP